MADSAPSDPGSAPTSGAAEGTRIVDPAKLKAMKGNVEAKYAGTQEALEKNKEKAEAESEGGGDQKKGLRAQRMEGIVKHHND